MKKVVITGAEDKTKELREVLNSNNEVQIIGKNILTNGLLPEDSETHKRGRIGEAGILRIKDKKDYVLSGTDDKTTFYTDVIPVPLDSSPIGYWDRSLRQFLNIIDSENVTVKNISFRSINTTEDPGKIGVPVFNTRVEFEHGFETERSKNVKILDCEVLFTYGDGVYVRNWECEDITIKNLFVKWCGRQGVAIAGGQRITLDNVVLEGGRRGYVDLEPPLGYQTLDGCIVKNGKTQNQLVFIPMGGKGTVRNVFIKDNEYKCGETTIVKGTSPNVREKIIFSGNKRLHPYSSSHGAYVFTDTNDILIENEINNLADFKGSYIIATLTRCKNVTIRNNDFYGAKFIDLRDTDPSEVKVYGNNVNLKFLINGEEVDIQEYLPTEEEVKTIPFETIPFIESEYYGEVAEPEPTPEPPKEEPTPPVEVPEEPIEEEPKPTPPVEEEPTPEPEQPEVTEEEAFNAFKTFMQFIKKQNGI